MKLSLVERVGNKHFIPNKSPRVGTRHNTAKASSSQSKLRRQRMNPSRDMNRFELDSVYESLAFQPSLSLNDGALFFCPLHSISCVLTEHKRLPGDIPCGVSTGCRWNRQCLKRMGERVSCKNTPRVRARTNRSRVSTMEQHQVSCLEYIYCVFTCPAFSWSSGTFGVFVRPFIRTVLRSRLHSKEHIDINDTYTEVVSSICNFGLLKNSLKAKQPPSPQSPLPITPLIFSECIMLYGSIGNFLLYIFAAAEYARKYTDVFCYRCLLRAQSLDCGREVLWQFNEVTNPADAMLPITSQFPHV